MQAAQLGAGVESELLGQDPAGRAEHVQRADHVAAPVQGHHELAVQPLPKGMPPDQLAQPLDRRHGPALRELDLRVLLHRAQILVGETGDHLAQGRPRGHVLGRRPSPQRQRPGVGVLRRAEVPPGQRLATACGQRLEGEQVELGRLDPQQVAGVQGDQPLGGRVVRRGAAACAVA